MRASNFPRRMSPGSGRVSTTMTSSSFCVLPTSSEQTLLSPVGRSGKAVIIHADRQADANKPQFNSEVCVIVASQHWHLAMYKEQSWVLGIVRRTATIRVEETHPLPVGTD